MSADELNKYLLTVRMLVQDYSAGDACIGVTDVFNSANIQHWLLDHSVDKCDPVGATVTEVPDPGHLAACGRGVITAEELAALPPDVKAHVEQLEQAAREVMFDLGPRRAGALLDIIADNVTAFRLEPAK